MARKPDDSSTFTRMATVLADAKSATDSELIELDKILSMSDEEVRKMVVVLFREVVGLHKRLNRLVRIVKERSSVSMVPEIASAVEDAMNSPDGRPALWVPRGEGRAALEEGRQSRPVGPVSDDVVLEGGGNGQSVVSDGEPAVVAEGRTEGTASPFPVMPPATGAPEAVMTEKPVEITPAGSR